MGKLPFNFQNGPFILQVWSIFMIGDNILDENFSRNDPFLFQASNIPDFNKSKFKKINNDCVTVRLHKEVK